MTDKPAPPTITLTNSAASRLGQLANTPGLLTAPDDLFRVGAFNEDHLSEIPKAPDAPLQTAPRAEIQAWEVAIKAWAKALFPPIVTTPKRVDAVKALLKSASEKGQLGGAAHDLVLLRAFGLAPSDE